MLRSRAARSALVNPALFGLALTVLCCRHQLSPFEQSLQQASNTDARQLPLRRAALQQAAAHAENDEQRAEALYRTARSWFDQGSTRKGASCLQELLDTYPRSQRAARSWLDLGRAFEALGETERAVHAYASLLGAHPESGNALSAAKRWVALMTQDALSPEQAWSLLLERHNHRELDEGLRYFHALALQKTDRIAAIEAFEFLARRYPLPRAAFTDEALLASAHLRRQIGDAAGALEALRPLLRQDTSAYLVGSYTRGAYLKAYLLKGRILRDDLGRPEQAERAFRTLVQRHRESRLADDALLEVARTRHGNEKDPCPIILELLRDYPASSSARAASTLLSASCEPQGAPSTHSQP